MRRRPPWLTDDEPFERGNRDRERDIPFWDGPAIDMQAGIAEELNREPQPLEESVRRGVEMGAYLDPLGLTNSLRPMDRAVAPEALLEDADSCFPFAVTLLKALLDHASLLVEQDRARIGNTPVAVLLGDLFVVVMLVHVVFQFFDYATLFPS